MWKSQYNRMLRSLDKAKKAQKIVPHYAVDHSYPEDSNLDDIYACAQNIYHLKDWVISTKTISKDDVYKFIDGIKDFEICEKICNGTKHLTPGFREGTLSINIYLQDAPYTQKGSHNKEFLYVFEYEGKIYKVIETFDVLVSEWQRFLKEKSLL